MGLLLLASLMARGAAEGAESENLGGSATPEANRVEPAVSPIQIDGRLEEEAWQHATRVRLEYEWFPGDNVEPPVKTIAYLTFDDSHFYAAFEAFDPEPSAIRAHLMDRDSVRTFSQDDHVRLMLDTFNDERRAFQFRVNPLGVQVDAIFSQVELVEDTSWDSIWESKGRITPEGYVVELAIPFNQLRFPSSAAGPQTWGIELGRSYPRSNRHRITAAPRDRDNSCLLCQVDKYTGFHEVEPGLNLELDPTVTMLSSEQRNPFPGGDLESQGTDFEPGLTARWGMTPSLSLLGTVNPDFSQVEADVAQLDVNERFALFFEEKRPFFLEGIDFFSTPIQAVFTRTVVDPEWGLKLSGKVARNAGGLFVTEDRVNNLLLPSNQASRFAVQRESVTGSVLRYRRDVRGDSTLGVLYAGREGPDYHNRVGGVDGFFRLSPVDEVRFQYLRSDTRYPGEIARRFDQPTDSFDGDGIRFAYDHAARHWSWSLGYDELDPGFRADSGFVPRVDVKTGSAALSRRFWGDEEDWYTNFDLGVSGLRTEDHAGRTTDEIYEVNGLVSGPKQSNLRLALRRVGRFVRGRFHDDLEQAELTFAVQPSGSVELSLFGQVGETVDFVNNRPADVLFAQPGVQLKLGRHLNARLNHTFQRLDVTGGELSEANLSELRLVYNLNVRSFFRAIVQYTDVERNPDLFVVPAQPEEEELFTQLLFSYKLNPKTVAFVGYTDDRLGAQGLSLTERSRTIFVKLGYAWVF